MGEKIKRIFSYIVPFSRKITTKYNSTVAVSFINGRKLLDSKNANYSYGSLQRVLDYALEQIAPVQAGHILALGLGGGSVIKLLRDKYQFDNPISAVEIDPHIIKIAEEEFQIKNDPITTITEADALNFVKNYDHRYDGIIVDIFIDDKVPAPFLKTEFWRDIIKLQPQWIIFNTMGENENLQKVKQYLVQNNYASKVYHGVQETNDVMISNLI